MRTPKPWYRSQNDTWYVCLHGKQVLPADNAWNQDVAQLPVDGGNLALNAGGSRVWPTDN